MTPGRPVWVTITSRDSGVSLEKRVSMWWPQLNKLPVVDVCPEHISDWGAFWSPHGVFHRQLRRSLREMWKQCFCFNPAPGLLAGEGEQAHQAAWSTHPGPAGAWSACTSIIVSSLHLMSVRTLSTTMFCLSIVNTFESSVPDKERVWPTCRWQRCRCRTEQGRSAWTASGVWRPTWRTWGLGRAWTCRKREFQLKW